MIGLEARFGRAAFLGVWIMLFGACADPPDSSEVLPSASDSAGIRIVTYSGDLPTPPAIKPALVFQHGFDAGDYEFQAAFYGRLQPDGSAFVGDPMSQEVVKIGANGGTHEIWARRGEGPGELRGMKSLVVVGQDTLWVEDYGNGKLLLLAHGLPLQTVSTQEDRTVRMGLMAHGIDDDGRFLMSTASYMSDFEEPWLRGKLVRFDANSGVADTVAEFDMAARRPVGKRSPYLVSGAMALSARQFVHGRTDIPTLHWRNSDGSVRQIVRWSPTPSYPTPEDWTQFEAGLRRDLRRVNPQMSSSEAARFIEEQVSKYEVREDEPLPLFGPLHGDDRGSVWVQPFAPGFTPRPGRYLVISPNGERIDSVEFPGPVQILDIRGNLVLAMITDDLDVQGVAVYSMALP